MPAHVLQHCQRSLLALLHVALGGDCDGVDDCLGMGLSYLAQKLVHQCSHVSVWVINACHQLGDHLQPSVNRDGSESFPQRILHFFVASVREPEGEEAKFVFESVGSVAEGNCTEEAVHCGQEEAEDLCAVVFVFGWTL